MYLMFTFSQFILFLKIGITKVASNSRIVLKPGSVLSICIPNSSRFEVVLASDNIIEENVTSLNVDSYLSLTECAPILLKM